MRKTLRRSYCFRCRKGKPRPGNYMCDPCRAEIKRIGPIIPVVNCPEVLRLVDDFVRPLSR